MTDEVVTINTEAEDLAAIELEEKKAFAFQLIENPNDPFQAALNVFPSNTTRALRIAHEWKNDKDVIEFKKQYLKSEDALKNVATKAELARETWRRLQAIPAEEVDAFVKIGDLFGKIMGYIQKPETNVVVNNQIDNRVMVVKDLGTNEEWEVKAAAQQRNLLSVSTSKH